LTKSKLYELLGTFDGHDYNRARKYLSSPFFNEDQELLLFYDVIHNFWIEKKPFPEDKKMLYAVVFGSGKFDDKHFRYLSSSLTKHLENFITQKWMQEFPRSFVLAKQKALMDRNCLKAFQYVTAEVRQLLDEGNQDSGVLLAMHDSALNEMEFQAVQKSRKSSFDFEAISSYLDRFYVARKLQIASGQINAQNVIAGQLRSRLLDQVNALASDVEFASVPSIELYQTIYLSLTEPEKYIHFEKLKKFIVEKGDLFSLKEQKEIVQYLKNFCIKQINLGKSEFVQQLFEIYKLSLQNKKALRSEKMSPWEYKNIVTIGLRMKEFEWVRKFIDDYNKYIEAGQQYNAMVYNLANWHFFRKEYKDTLKLFQEVEFTDLYYQLDVRAILLKTYFELDDDEPFYYQASAFRSFLSRNRLMSDYQRKIYRNFVRYIVRLLRDSGNKKKLQVLLEDIRQVRQIADFRWLEEKVLEDLAED